MAKGDGLTPVKEQEQTIKYIMEAFGTQIHSGGFFRRDGPDVIAYLGEEFWKFECKGVGIGKTSTLKNNFDRAVASVISYYDKPGTRLASHYLLLILDSQESCL